MSKTKHPQTAKRVRQANAPTHQTVVSGQASPMASMRRKARSQDRTMKTTLITEDAASCQRRLCLIERSVLSGGSQCLKWDPCLASLLKPDIVHVWLCFWPVHAINVKVQSGFSPTKIEGRILNLVRTWGCSVFGRECHLPTGFQGNDHVHNITQNKQHVAPLRVKWSASYQSHFFRSCFGGFQQIMEGGSPENVCSTLCDGIPMEFAGNHTPEHRESTAKWSAQGFLCVPLPKTPALSCWDWTKASSFRGPRGGTLKNLDLCKSEQAPHIQSPHHTHGPATTLTHTCTIPPPNQDAVPTRQHNQASPWALDLALCC